MRKSFVTALITGQEDQAELAPLMDEIWIRDLDLHPAPTKEAKFADTGKPVPQNAYKIGAGPTKAGDRLIFIDKMPVLSAKPSVMYEAFIGRSNLARLTLKDCRIKFENDKSKTDAVLICDVWNEFFWQRFLEPKPVVKPREREMSLAILKAKESANNGNYSEKRRSKVAVWLAPQLGIAPPIKK